MLLKIRRKYGKFIASVSMLTIAYQLVFPVTAMALTSGPSQPEIQSFEPVGTTDMVNMFTGNFTYNIPLLDIEGYPINIAYHSGITMEQEASWVGLGWNINPGNVNRFVRGVPDDFKGDKIEKTLKIEPDKTVKVSLFSGVEIAGFETDKLTKKAKDALKQSKGSGMQLDFGININNYTGISASIGKATTANIPFCNVGVNLGATVSTDNGTDFDYSASFRMSRALKSGDQLSLTSSLSGSMNSRAGVQYTSLGVGVSVGREKEHCYIDRPVGYTHDGVSASASNSVVPIGLMNYVPVVTNATSGRSSFFRIKIGGEAWMIYPYGGGTYSQSKVSIEEDGSKDAYGYFHMEDAGDGDIVDFTRDKDGNVNRKSKYLPMASMTYDVYEVNGQGTGGSFRALRNDVGTVYDPEIATESFNQSHMGEIGFGNVVEGGYDMKLASTDIYSGPWKDHKKAFRAKSEKSFYEPFYFKQAGELTEGNTLLQEAYFKHQPLPFTAAKLVMIHQTPDTTSKRVPRANLIHFLTAEEASIKQISLEPKIVNYTKKSFKKYGQVAAQKEDIDRHGTQGQKEYHASMYSQLLPDGRRYVYGIPAMNKEQIDYEVSCSAPSGDVDRVDISYSGTDPVPVNSGLTKKYYSKTKTPAYAHSYLLTQVLSPGYVDVTGDGISDDDWGEYTKFNYSCVEKNYKWRAPYGNKALYNRGIKSNCHDDRASFSIGEREEWLLHSVESRNQIAEFYVSERLDGRGIDGNQGLSASSAKSYKLDSIVLYNKRDRYENEFPVPIKSIVFSYDYSLCKGIPNTTAPTGANGKLTLKAIYTRYGNSDIGYLSPYKFKYDNGSVNTNPNYDPSAKDCWGVYKPTSFNSANGFDFNNTDFPYVTQRSTDNQHNINANSWNLRQIFLPSGGVMRVTYESDDYAYVQDKRAMEMFKVEGAGPTAKFETSNELYKTFEDPYVYLYFKRDLTKEIYPSDLRKSYLQDQDLLYFNFDVLISSGQTSCGGSVIEQVRGYASIVEVGPCTSNSTMAYVKIATKTPNSMGALKAISKDAKINPISLAAINFARYYYTKALDPESELTADDDPSALIKALMNSMGTFKNFYENPLKTYLKQSKAKYFTIGKSYVRLISQGLKKKGGGHRVKKLEFFDNWEGSTNASSYGSNYDYTTKDEFSGATISSGVASYEPLMGGSENPCRNLLNIDETGNDTKFPPVDPIELIHEGPLGESFYPPSVVGYSKVTVTSIHKNEGQSSQAIQEYEFYTAKDFPVYSTNTLLQTLEDKKPKLTQLFNKKEVYRVAQGYSLFLNDMHGKPKKQSLWVAKYDPANINAATDSKELISYTKHNYYTNNQVPCLEFVDGALEPKKVLKTIGEEIDYTTDSRLKKQTTDFTNCMFSVNVFIAPPLPIGVPVALPTFKKESVTFSSLVNTKIIQRYGIVESIETYDKGAVMRVSNDAFDPITGQVLVTRVNTENNDNAYNVKYPAYWAYTCMGGAYENILYEESFRGNSYIQNNYLYLNSPNPERYNIGDEVILKGEFGCTLGERVPQTFKAWIVDISKMPEVPPNFCTNMPHPCAPNQNGNGHVTYTRKDGTCMTFTEIKAYLYDLTKDPVFSPSNTTLNGRNFEKITVSKPALPIFPYYYTWGLWPCKVDVAGADGGTPLFSDEEIRANVSAFYTTNSDGNTPYVSPNVHKVEYKAYIERKLGIDYAPYPTPTPPGNWMKNTIATITVTMASAAQSNCYYTPVHTSSQVQSNYFVFLDQAQSDTKERGVNGNICHRHLGTIATFGAEANCNNGPRGSDKPMCLVLAPINKNALDAYGNTSAPLWKEYNKVNKASIKVIRSGKRNMLNESVQEVTTLESPYDPSTLRLKTAFNKVVDATSRKFKHNSQLPEQVIDASNFIPMLITNNVFIEVGNQYANGKLGVYRFDEDHKPHKDRNYNNTTYHADRERGTYDLTELKWNFSTDPEPNSWYPFNRFSRMRVNDNSPLWKRRNRVAAYCSNGFPIQTTDALGVQHAQLAGYDGRLVIADVINSENNKALYNGFEDYKDLFLNPKFQIYHDEIKKFTKEHIDGNTFQGLQGYPFNIIKGGHTGVYAMQFTGATTLHLPYGINYLGPYYPYGKLTPFHYYFGDYLFSVWQKVSGTTIPPQASIKINHGSGECILKPRTPIIEGWVLYEGECYIPYPPDVNLPGIYTTDFIVTGACVIDDLRIMRGKESNMKCYVYHPVTRKLVASLDENHMATFFEYNAEGKLSRVKKETERGIITVKEARQALRNTFSNPSSIQPTDNF